MLLISIITQITNYESFSHLISACNPFSIFSQPKFTYEVIIITFIVIIAIIHCLNFIIICVFPFLKRKEEFFKFPIAKPILIPMKFDSHLLH